MEKVYIDTNIFDYVALRNPTYGAACKLILDDIGSHLDAVCSYLVPIEILGSLSDIDPILAADALVGFFSFNLKIVGITEKTMKLAGDITRQTGLSGYDAVHLSVMRNEQIGTIISENYRDFGKINGLKLVRPLEYERWKAESKG
jgi:predicted nucleic acid-binding protein